MSALTILASAALCVGSVHDGDTLRTCAGERVRIANIDAPEMPDSPKCTGRTRRGWCDYRLAERSRDALAGLLAASPARLRRIGRDKYGRTLAIVTVNGQDAGEYLIARGLARRW
ncbi:nuclease homologue [Novosphingobium sp. CF614]|uniref:thermonuclease family protein n=1 Tax=Novosphingobium sp. CF614 TaxID=1884364 RepID=UPI0008DFA7AD|nr:thermonuclease family protein [Novosphingobium sp. CF614]SFG08636.1 nuclease homologue [Novosphingobium sp. CF614]